ncbi:MAG: ROK family protein [Nitrospirota bacterium]
MNKAQARNAIGMDIGGTNLRVAVVSGSGGVLKKIKEPVSEDVLGSMIKAVESLGTEGISGIGIGVAGVINRENGRVVISPNLQAVEKIGLVSEISSRFGLPVLIENDANAAAYAELWAGAGRDFSDFFLFTLGTGIGGGIIHEKKLLDVSAEVGHMSISPEGEKCHCGNYGCLELYASARAILSNAVSVLESGRESALRDCCGGNIYKLTAEDVFRAALEGDNLARELLKTAGRHLGIGIANVVNLLSPEAVILAGGLIGAWDIYVQEAVREASRRALKELFEGVKILPSLLKDDAGVVGAAGLMLEKLKEIYSEG